MPYFLGVDVGATKTHAVVIDHVGRVCGFGRAGAGNPEDVGLDGLHDALEESTAAALSTLPLGVDELAGAGFGVAGYDWPHDLAPIAGTVAHLGLVCPIRIANDAVPGIVIGTREGWGLSLVSGTGCNCWGWDRGHRREGRVTGHGLLMGEHAGAGELVHRAMQLVGHSWTRRIGPTALTDAFVAHTGASGVEELIAGYATHRLPIGADAASLVFDVAAAGDMTARGLIDWAGQELGELANAVIRQLEFEHLEFEIVMVGGMFDAGEPLVAGVRRTVHALAPGARLVRLTAPPALGAALIGMEAAGWSVDDALRSAVSASFADVRRTMA